DRPPRILLQPVLVPALGARITQTGSATGLVRGVVFEIAAGRGSPAGRAGTRGMPDLGQVPELDAGIVPGGLEPVIAGIDGDRVDREEQAGLSGDPGAEPPGSVSAGWSVPAGGREGEGGTVRAGPGPVRGGLAGRVSPAGRV